MAIYFPPLFCPKGSIIEPLEKIDFEDFYIEKGERCYVHNIIGYGYDIFPLSDDSKVFRVMNKQMPDYFKVLYSPVQDELSNQFSEYKARFVKPFQIEGVIDIAKGKEFYFQVDRTDKSFYDLYDDYRKVIRLKESEANEYLEFME